MSQIKEWLAARSRLTLIVLGLTTLLLYLTFLHVTVVSQGRTITEQKRTIKDLSTVKQLWRDELIAVYRQRNLCEDAQRNVSDWPTR